MSVLGRSGWRSFSPEVHVPEVRWENFDWAETQHGIDSKHGRPQLPRTSRRAVMIRLEKKRNYIASCFCVRCYVPWPNHPLRWVEQSQISHWQRPVALPTCNVSRPRIQIAKRQASPTVVGEISQDRGSTPVAHLTGLKHLHLTSNPAT